MPTITVRQDRNGDASLPSGWETKIQEADARAQGMLHCLWIDLEQVFNQRGAGSARRRRRIDAWKSNTLICRWWGNSSVTNNEIKDVRRRISKMRNWMQKGIHYIVIKEQSGTASRSCDTGTVAYVTPPFSNTRVRLCPLWFAKNLNYRAGVLIHELTHHLGLGKPHFGVSSKNDALDLAKNRPRKARKSPDNYMYLAMDYSECATRLRSTTRLGVEYQVHAKNRGWLPPVSNQMVAGTTGQRRRIEALKVRLLNPTGNMSIHYKVYAKRKRWLPEQSNWKIAGTIGEQRRLEAVQIWLKNAPKGAFVRYRVHAKGNGWMSWVQDGATAGTTGQSRRIEAIQIEVGP